MSVLAGGVFAAKDVGDDAELRGLVDELGRRSYDAGLGRRGVPDQFDAELWRHLEETGLARLTSTPDVDAGPHELAPATRPRCHWPKPTRSQVGSAGRRASSYPTDR
jgi:acyl-CoA dehydrogenase